MSNNNEIKKAWERNAAAVKLRPSVAVSEGKSTIKVTGGTTCTIEGSGWTLTGDVGIAAGGNNAGPGPGVFERAALGSCLAIGYAQQAAVMGVPIEGIEVEIETKFDARGMLGVVDQPPGFTKITYNINITSPAPVAAILKVIDVADQRSPVRDDFRRAIPIERNQVNIHS